MGAMLEWGTYNAGSSVRRAALVGMRLSEIPPGVFMRKDPSTFLAPYERYSGYFSVITAHGPYYAITGQGKDDYNVSVRAHVRAAQIAERYGATVYNLHLGGAGEDRERSIELASDAVKQIISATESIAITLETTYWPRNLGTPEDIRAIVESVDSERVGISFQLENDFVREFRVYESGNFSMADAACSPDFWYRLLSSNEDLFAGHVSLRFSQVIGMYIRRKLFVKKRVPLGRGYPSLDVMAEGVAKYIVQRAHEELPVHIIYTGPSETKFHDTLELYHSVAREVGRHL